MHEQVLINGQILSASDAGVSSTSAAALHGKGVFTTVAIHSSSPFLWEKHWHRLENNADKLKIDLAEFSEDVTKTALDEIIRQNKVSHGRARITFFDERSSDVWPSKSERKTTMLIL